MAEIAGKQGKELLHAILNELKNLDPRIVPFDSDDVQTLEYGVIQGVRDVFGSESPEYSELEGFRISAGNISRGDSRAEKQSKYELGLPKAAERVEELLNLIDQSEEHIQDLSTADLVEVTPTAKVTGTKTAPPKAVPRAKTNELDTAPTAKPTPKAVPKTAEPTKKSFQSSHGQPGRILLLQEGGDDISLAHLPARR